MEWIRRVGIDVGKTKRQGKSIVKIRRAAVRVGGSGDENNKW